MSVEKEKFSMDDLSSRSTTMVAISGTALQEEIDKIGVKHTVVCRVLRKGDTYIKNCVSRNRISQEAIDAMEHIFGIDPKAYVVPKKEEPAVTEDASKELPQDIQNIRAAVYNGVVDAILMLIKDGAFKSILVDAISDKEYSDKLVKVIYNGVNGVRKKIEYEKKENAYGNVTQAVLFDEVES